MNKSILICTLVCAAGILTACSTPREQCISNATQQYRNAERALAVAQGNVDRGYAVFNQSVPYTVATRCVRTDPTTKVKTAYVCPSTRYRTQSTPVAIDAAEERRKAANLRKRLPQLRQQADAAIRQCNSQFPA